MKYSLKTILLVLCAFSFSYCSSDKTSPEAQEIGLSTQNDDTFRGTVEINNDNVSYHITATEELVFEVKLLINQKNIDATINYEEESLKFDGYDNILTSKEKNTLLETGQSIATYLLEQKQGDISMIEYTLLSLIEYFAKSPPDYQYIKRSVNPKNKTLALKSQDDGISCIKKNTTVTAEYDDAGGNQNDRVKVGSTARQNYECMGRCGAGCGRWWIASSWTKDCLDHDQCSNVNNASDGASDKNCGDEFNEAADDYVFGVLRGCRG